MDKHSQIVARAKRGAGGNIDITTGVLLKSQNSLINADSELEIDGNIQITEPDTNILESVTALPVNFFSGSTLLTEPCASRSGADVITLVNRRYDVLPDSPYALRVPLSILTSTSGSVDTSFTMDDFQRPQTLSSKCRDGG